MAHSNQMVHNAFNIITALWVIGLPLMDILGIMVRRVRKGQSPLRPDRNHLHHIFLRAGISSKQSLLLIVLANSVIVGCGILFAINDVPQWRIMIIYLIIFIFYSILYVCHMHGCWGGW